MTAKRVGKVILAKVIKAQKGAGTGHKQAVLQVSTAAGVVANAMLYTLISRK